MIHTIAVIFGGRSCEHEISILSALQVMHTLNEKYQVYPVYISHNSEMYTNDSLFELETYQHIDWIEKRKDQVTLVRKGNEVYLQPLVFYKRKRRIDFVFPIMHGKNGEDGCIQGMLEILHVPYAGSDVLASAIAMSKSTMKQLLRGYHYPVLEDEVVDDRHKTCTIMPCIIKPDCLGSSIGIQVVSDPNQYIAKIEEALLYDERCLIEPYLEDFYEINCSVRKKDGKVITSLLEKVKGKEEILSFVDKYENKEKYNGSDEIDSEIAKQIHELSASIYNDFHFEGVIRIDYIISRKQIYVNEINTIPGSYAFYLWKEESMLELLESVMKEALKQYALRECKITSFRSNVLFHYQGVRKGKV